MLARPMLVPRAPLLAALKQSEYSAQPRLVPGLCSDSDPPGFMFQSVSSTHLHLPALYIRFLLRLH